MFSNAKYAFNDFDMMVLMILIYCDFDFEYFDIITILILIYWYFNFDILLL